MSRLHHIGTWATRHVSMLRRWLSGADELVEQGKKLLTGWLPPGMDQELLTRRWPMERFLKTDSLQQGTSSTG